MSSFSTIVLLVLCITLVHSQAPLPEHLRLNVNKAVELQKRFKPKAALEILEDVLKKIQSDPTNKTKEVGKIYYHIASCKLDLAAYNEAKILLDEALQIFQSRDTVSLEIADTYMLLGIYYDYMADYDKALAYYDLTKSMYLKLFPPNNYRFGYLYNNIGICIYFKGDIERALAFFNKSLAVTVEAFGNNHVEVSKELNNISFCYSSTKKIAPSKKVLDIAMEIVNKNKFIDSPRGANSFHSLALVYFYSEEYDKALSHFQTAYKIRKKHLPEQHDEIASSYFMMASIYVKMGKLDQAKDYFLKAQNIYIDIFGEKHPETASVYTQLASIELKNTNLDAAKENINFALSILDYDGNIPIQKEDKFDLNILEALDLQAKIYFKLWENTNDIIDLKKANRAYQDLIFLLNNFRKGFKEDLSKEILAGDFFHIFDGAIETSFALFENTQQEKYLHDAFRNCEYSTSFVLLEGRKNIGAKKLAAIPDSLLQKEKDLKFDITELEKQKRYEEQREKIDQNKIITLAGQIFDLKEQLYQLIKVFENKYPRYYKFKYDISIVDIKQVQKQTLDHDQVLVEYFIGENNIFTFIISKDSFLVKKIEKPFPLEKWVTTLKNNIIQFQYPFNLENDYHEELVNSAEALYWEIVNPIEKHFKERLIIIPVGVLAEIPFECFIKKTGSASFKYKEHHYLSEDYAISYCYSATLLNEMIQNRKPNAIDNTIAFAPSFEQFGQSSNLRDLFLLPLDFNEPEVEEIANIMGAKKVVGAAATKASFMEHFPHFNIIHFATHAQADQTNSEFSFLAFSGIKDTIENELLFVKDLYNLELSSEMITLSACQTGYGENRKGEGIISLARGFSFSGTCNINTSLWNVNDAQTASLMKLFYKNIRRGLTKDKALQIAKKQLKTQQYNNLNAHPFYWTAMISIGDMRTMNIPWSPNRLFWVLIFLLSGSILFLLKRRLKSSIK